MKSVFCSPAALDLPGSFLEIQTSMLSLGLLSLNLHFNKTPCWLFWLLRSEKQCSKSKLHLSTITAENQNFTGSLVLMNIIKNPSSNFYFFPTGHISHLEHVPSILSPPLAFAPAVLTWSAFEFVNPFDALGWTEMQPPPSSFPAVSLISGCPEDLVCFFLVCPTLQYSYQLYSC